MFSAAMLFALSGYVAQAGQIVPVSQPWVQDYALACRQGRTFKRPLAVFLAPGPRGKAMLSKEGTLETKAQRLLESRYISVFIDTSTPNGKRLASSFELPEGHGLVISDLSGEKQAFWHTGALNNHELGRYLDKYADPNREVVTTETVVLEQPPVEFSAPDQPVPPIGVDPSISYPQVQPFSVAGGC